MLTRSGRLRQTLEEETSTISATSDKETLSVSEFSSTSQVSSNLSSESTRMEKANAALIIQLRKKLGRINNKITRIREKLGSQRDQNSPATSDHNILQDTLTQIQEYEKEYVRIGEELFELETDNNALAEDEARADEFDRAMAVNVKDCQYLMTTRNVYQGTLALETAIRSLTTAYEASPANNHSTTSDLVKLRAKDLEVYLLASLLAEEEELRGRST